MNIFLKKKGYGRIFIAFGLTIDKTLSGHISSLRYAILFGTTVTIRKIASCITLVVFFSIVNIRLGILLFCFVFLFLRRLFFSRRRLFTASAKTISANVTGSLTGRARKDTPPRPAVSDDYPGRIRVTAGPGNSVTFQVKIRPRRITTFNWFSILSLEYYYYDAKTTAASFSTLVYRSRVMADVNV